MLMMLMSCVPDLLIVSPATGGAYVVEPSWTCMLCSAGSLVVGFALLLVLAGGSRN